MIAVVSPISDQRAAPDPLITPSLQGRNSLKHAEHVAALDMAIHSGASRTSTFRPPAQPPVKSSRAQEAMELAKQ